MVAHGNQAGWKALGVNSAAEYERRTIALMNERTSVETMKLKTEREQAQLKLQQQQWLLEQAREQNRINSMMMSEWLPITDGHGLESSIMTAAMVSDYMVENQDPWYVSAAKKTYNVVSKTAYVVSVAVESAPVTGDIADIYAYFAGEMPITGDSVDPDLIAAVYALPFATARNVQGTVDVLEGAEDLIRVSRNNADNVIKSTDNAIRNTTAKITDKIKDQMIERGWNPEKIQDVLSNPFTTRESVNKATNNPATAYYMQNGHYVVVDDVTEDIIQISNLKISGSDWYPDSAIIDPYIPLNF